MSKVIVKGMGMVTSLGLTYQENVNAIFQGQHGFKPISRFDVAGSAQQQAAVLSIEQETYLRSHYDEADLLYAMLMKAGDEALQNQTIPQRTGLIFATNFGFIETKEWLWREWIDHAHIDHELFFKTFQLRKLLMERWNLNGPSVQLSLSCASGAAALVLGWYWLHNDWCDAVLILAGDILTEFIWGGLFNLQTITPDMIRPFDRHRQGTLFGEGVGAVFLQRGDYHTITQDTPVILGGAVNNNAWHMTAPAKEGAGSLRVMRAALNAAGCDPSQISMISAHATGTPPNDITESQAIQQLFQNRKVPVAAFKSQLGHLMGGAGLVEAMLTIECMKRKEIPPILHTQDIDPECTVDLVWPHPRKGSFSIAITNSAGIGGNNASVVLALGNVTISQQRPPRRSAKVNQYSWILPEYSQTTKSWVNLSPDSLLTQRSTLANFSAKNYIKTVKGYLDPSSNFALAAVGQLLSSLPCSARRDRIGIVAATYYGPLFSSYRYYETIVKKGIRFASPLIFPHTFTNTPSNLVAIEFTFGGPHIVLETVTDPSIPFKIAEDFLSHGDADGMLVLLYESIEGEGIPSNVTILPGAICGYLECEGTEPSKNYPSFSEGLPLHGIIYSALQLNSTL